MIMQRIEQVLEKMGQRPQSRASIYLAMKHGLLTKQVSVSTGDDGRVVAWPSHEVDLIVAAQVAGQSKEQIRELVNKLHAQRTERFNELLAQNTGSNINVEVADKPGSSDMTVRELLQRLGSIQSSAARGIATMTGPAYEQSAATFARGVFAIEMIQRVIDGGL